MKLSLNIFKTKADLTAAIKASKSFSIDLHGIGNFFISFDEDGDTSSHWGCNITNLVRTDEDGTEHDYEHHGTFFAALWKEMKNFAHISILWIDGERQDLIKMENDANIAEAKKSLNKTQINDRSIGMVKVTEPLRAKMTLTQDQSLIDLADAFQDLVTDYNATNGFGRGKYTKGNMKSNKARMMKAMNEMYKAMDAMPTESQIKKKYSL